MSERIEHLMRTYPDKRLELKVMEMQLRHFAGITEDEVIHSMYFTQPEGERVQISRMSDKTANIALNYRDRQERINREWYEYLFHQYEALQEELDFFEASISQLSGSLPGVIYDLVIRRETWETIMQKNHIYRKTLAKYRKKAIAEVDRMYELRDSQVESYLLE